MILYIARHGETDWNRTKRLQSRSDIPLNETGFSQAKRMHHYIRCAGLNLTKAVVSPLIRARQTAEIILSETNIPIDFDDRLIELSFGEFEGHYEAELHDKFEETFDEWRRQCFLDAAPGGESLDEAVTRVSSLVHEIRRTNGNCLIVAHQAINMAVMAAISQRKDVASLLDFKQRNNQLECWDLLRGTRIERVTI